MVSVELEISRIKVKCENKCTFRKWGENMIKYIISDNKGNYIRLDNSSGKYVSIRSLSQAQKWDSYQKAKAIYQNCISKTIRDRFVVKEINDGSFHEIKTEPMMKEFIYEECKHDIDDLLKKISDLSLALEKVNSWEEPLKNQVSMADRKRSDYDHYVEFGKFNAVQCCKNAKLHKSILQERRKLKQTYTIMKWLQDMKLSEKSIKGLFHSIESLETSVYQPRVLTELFS